MSLAELFISNLGLISSSKGGVAACARIPATRPRCPRAGVPLSDATVERFKCGEAPYPRVPFGGCGGVVSRSPPPDYCDVFIGIHAPARTHAAVRRQWSPDASDACDFIGGQGRRPPGSSRGGGPSDSINLVRWRPRISAHGARFRLPRRFCWRAMVGASGAGGAPRRGVSERVDALPPRLPRPGFRCFERMRPTGGRIRSDRAIWLPPPCKTRRLHRFSSK